MNKEEIEEIKKLLFQDRLTQYGKRKLVQHLEQKEAILDKVTDKLKERIKELDKLKENYIKLKEYDQVDFTLCKKREVQKILNIIEGVDILNKMANGELEDGFSFAYKGMIYAYDKKEDAIENCNNNSIGNNYKLEKCLNDEVLIYKKDEKANTIEIKVIEENKEIEELNKISYDEFKYTDDKYRFDLTNIEYDKINELVRAVNKLNKEREEK